MDDNFEDELVDYEEEEEAIADPTQIKEEAKESTKGSYAGVHSSGFRDFLLRPELLQAIADAGFEHPSEVQSQCIPNAVLGVDIICQAKSGMGKTAVFVLAILHQLQVAPDTVSVVIMCHTRELAFQVCKEFDRFSKYVRDVKTAVFYGGVPMQAHRDVLKAQVPNIVVGTPGRTLQLVKEGLLDLSHVKHFVVDEADQMLGEFQMRKDVQEIFRACPRDKQTMAFSATMPDDIRPTIKRFLRDPMEVLVDDARKLTLHGLQQYFVKIEEDAKNRMLDKLLKGLEFNQVVIFVSSVRRAISLNSLLKDVGQESINIHSGMTQEKRIEAYKKFKDFESRILVATNLWGRGMDIERVNIVFNYDMPESSDTYLHRVGRAGRFGTKGLAVSFVSSDEDNTILEEVQKRFEVKITDLPEKIEPGSYMNA